ncbi:hypothetical protein KKA14_10260 [bacterium]|nr:hypothetical protein [bacterium]
MLNYNSLENLLLTNAVPPIRANIRGADIQKQEPLKAGLAKRLLSIDSRKPTEVI